MTTWKSLLLLGPAALIAGGCVGQSTHDNLKAAHLKSLEENRNLQGELAAMRNSRQNWENERRAADAERGRLEQDLKNMRAALERALAVGAGADAAVVEKYQKEIARLQSALDELARNAPPPPVAGPVLPKDVNENIKRLAAEFGLTFDERTGMLRFPSDLLFPSGQDALLPGGAAPLQKLAAVIDHPMMKDYRIRIVGHTDKRPISNAETARRFPSNWHLSCARSIAVMTELLKTMDRSNSASIERIKDRFEVGGRGQRELLDNGNTEEAHRKNRRVEIYFMAPPAAPTRTITAAGN
jgi:chemotaxis protein MotB